MAEELEKNTQDSSVQPKQSSDASREGYRPQQGYQRDFVNGRVQRPRIHTQRSFSTDKMPVARKAASVPKASALA